MKVVSNKLISYFKKLFFIIKFYNFRPFEEKNKAVYLKKFRIVAQATFCEGLIEVNLQLNEHNFQYLSSQRSTLKLKLNI